MGRKPSNVYDFFDRVDTSEEAIGNSRVKYECKTCKKQYVANATKLAEHLRQSGCSPSFQSNQGSSSEGKMHEECDIPIINRLAQVSTCALADAMEQMKLKGFMPSLSLLPGYTNPLCADVCGPAYTIQMSPTSGVAVRKIGYHYADAAPRGSVIIISSPGDIDVAVCGGLAATQAKLRGCAGLITDGKCRDMAEICGLDFHVFARGTTVRGRHGRLAMTSVGNPVIIDGCTIRNNDIIRADINGIVVIPLERASDILLRAELIEQQDAKVEEAIRTGDTIQSAVLTHRV